VPDNWKTIVPLILSRFRSSTWQSNTSQTPHVQNSLKSALAWMSQIQKRQNVLALHSLMLFHRKKVIKTSLGTSSTDIQYVIKKHCNFVGINNIKFSVIPTKISFWNIDMFTLTFKTFEYIFLENQWHVVCWQQWEA
jgi:hypothetical protein